MIPIAFQKPSIPHPSVLPDSGSFSFLSQDKQTHTSNRKSKVHPHPSASTFTSRGFSNMANLPAS